MKVFELVGRQPVISNMIRNLHMEARKEGKIQKVMLNIRKSFQ
jgi:hypothetical protein